MKAVVLTGYGDVDKLEMRDVPDPPKPGTDLITVRMRGASINPIDWKLRSGAYKGFLPLEFPAVLGRDVAGEVVAVGPGVTAFERGDRVLGTANQTYAELVVGRADGFAKVPAGMDVADAGALPLVLVTGAQLIDEAVQPAEGDAVLITGATGSVGRAAVFAARSHGLKVYAGVRAKYRGEAAQLGVAGVVALDDAGDLDRLPLLDAIADTVGGETTQKLLGKLKPGGTIGSVVGEPDGARARGFVVRAFLAHDDSKRLGQLVAAVAAGKLAIPIAARFPLAEAREAQKLAEKGASGKVLLLG